MKQDMKKGEEVGRYFIDDHRTRTDGKRKEEEMRTITVNYLVILLF